MGYNSLNRIKRILGFEEKVLPKTYLEELAEMGVLETYLNDFLKDKFHSDEEFREKVYEALFKYNKNISFEVESYYLSKLVESLEFFLEYTKSCRNQTL